MLKSFLTKKITRSQLDAFLARYASSARTMDIGCSDAPYRSYFPNRIGVDVAPGPRVDVVADAHALPFPNESFDIILCTEVLEHLHTPPQAIAEMKRVLKRGGTLLLSTRFVFPLHDVPDDYFRFTKYGLRHLFREWDIVELREETDTIGTIAVLFQRIGFQARFRANKIVKACFFLFAKIIQLLSFLIVKEYGNIQKTVPEVNILSAGYYLACRKP